MVQSIALIQRDENIHNAACQPAKDHQRQNAAIRAQIRQNFTDAEKGKGAGILFFIVLPCGHALVPSPCRSVCPASV